VYSNDKFNSTKTLFLGGPDPNRHGLAFDWHHGDSDPDRDFELDPDPFETNTDLKY
jgi:hypothetical protein